MLSMVGTGAIYAATLIVTPFTIRLFGAEQYGVWTLVLLIVGYLGFADLGMSPASTRFASEAFSRSDRKGEAEVIWTALFSGLIPTGVVLVGLFALARTIVVGLLRVPTHLQPAAIMAVRLGGLMLVGKVITGVANTAEMVRLRMEVFYGINSVGGVLQVLLVPVALWLGSGLPGAVGVTAVVALGIGGAHFYVCGRLLPEFRKPAFRYGLSRSLLCFGFPAVLAFLAECLVINSEKLALARYTNPRAVALYAVACSFAGLLAAPALAMNQALVPAFSRLLSEADEDRLRVFYRRVVRGFLFWVVPGIFLLCLLCRPFLTLWAGPEFGAASPPAAYILIFGFALESFGYIPSRLLLAANQSQFMAKCYALQIVPYFCLIAMLTTRYGALGAATAWTIRAFVNTGMLWFQARRLTRGEVNFFPAGGVWFMAAVLPYVAVMVLAGSGISHPALLFLAFTPTAMIAYAGVIWRKVLLDEERVWALRSLRSFITCA